MLPCSRSGHLLITWMQVFLSTTSLVDTSQLMKWWSGQDVGWLFCSTCRRKRPAAILFPSPSVVCQHESSVVSLLGYVRLVGHTYLLDKRDGKQNGGRAIGIRGGSNNTQYEWPAEPAMQAMTYGLMYVHTTETNSTLNALVLGLLTLAQSTVPLKEILLYYHVYTLFKKLSLFWVNLKCS